MPCFLYVDDIIICGTQGSEILKLKEELNKNFRMTDLGLANHHLGLNIIRKEDEITETSQYSYLEDILQQFGMQDCKHVSTPMESNARISFEQTGNKQIERECRQLIGCLMYAALGSRPDLGSSVNYLSRYQNSRNEDV